MFKFLRDKLRSWRTKAEEAEEIISEEAGIKIRERRLEEVLSELELTLMEADVAMPVVEKIKEELKGELLGKRIPRAVGFSRGIEVALRNSMEKVLSAKKIDLVDFVEKKDKPVVILFVGVNGTGKTTVIAKLVHLLQGEGYSCVIAAADTFRAGAIEQLERHSERLGAKLIKHQAGSDPAAVAYDAVEHAKARGRDVVLIDTAGRMQTNVNLMDQMKKIKRVARPDMTIFVGDALAGNDAVEQARRFEEAVGIDAAILAKIDADAKGGAALSIAHAIGKPIIYVGTGQGYEDLMPFDAKWMVERLFKEE